MVDHAGGICEPCSLDLVSDHEISLFGIACVIFSSPGRSPGTAIVLPLALALALAKCLSFYVKVFLCDGQGAVRRAILSL